MNKLEKAVMQPVAWMTEDGRVASNLTKQNSMASPSKEAFNIPLYLSCVIAQPEQATTPVAHAEPVATVIEELDHDGQGWCSKVRWLYNPVPLGEILFWEQSK